MRWPMGYGSLWGPALALCLVLVVVDVQGQQPWDPLDSISNEILAAVRAAGDEDMLSANRGLAGTVQGLMFSESAAFFELEELLPHAEPLVVPISVEVILVQDRLPSRPSYSFIDARQLEELLEAAVVRRPIEAARAHATWYDDADDHHVAECGGVEKVAQKLSGMGGQASRTGRTLVEQEIHFSVTAGKALVSELTAAIGAALETGERMLPYEVTDDVIADHFARKRRLMHSYAFYVINVDLGEHNDKVQYTYAGDNDNCGSSMQVGKERYAWLDMRAGPVDMGNRVTGVGLASEQTVPFAVDYPPFAPSNGGHAEVPLAGFLSRSVELLLTPALDHLPGLLPVSGPVPKLVIRLIAVHDHPLGGAHLVQTLRWWDEDVEKVLRQVDGIGGQEIVFEKEHIELGQNTPAAAIVASSIRMQMSTYLDESGQLASHTYLDTRELRHSISRSRRALLLEETEAIVVPIYLFHVEDERMTLLDRSHLAVAYPELAVALSLPSSSVLSEGSCGSSAVFVDPRKPARAVLAAALQSVWGVLPPTTFWSHAHGALQEDWAWAGGRNPFGVISGSFELSFAQLDAAHRNQLVNLINSTLTTIVAANEKALSYYSEEDIILALDAQGTFLDMASRWGLFQWKLQHAAQSMALQDWDQCFALVRSAQHDAVAMVALLDDAADGIRSYLVCEKTEVQPFSRALNVVAPLSSFLLLVVVAGWFFRAKLLKFAAAKAKKKR